MDIPSYTLQQLASLTGSKVRTLRKWLIEGALSTTEFRGRGTTYGQRHLDEIRAIRKLRADNLSLSAIRVRLVGLSSVDLRKIAGVEAPLAASPTRGPAGAAAAAVTEVPRPPPEPTYPADRWEHVVLMPGLELRVRGDGGPLLRRIAQDIYDHYGVRL